jgi:hypothetical protein
MEDEVHKDEGTEFHILGADELKIREPVTVWTPGWWTRFYSVEHNDRLVEWGEKTWQVGRLVKSKSFLSRESKFEVDASVDGQPVEVIKPFNIRDIRLVDYEVGKSILDTLQFRGVSAIDEWVWVIEARSDNSHSGRVGHVNAKTVAFMTLRSNMKERLFTQLWDMTIERQGTV